VKKKIKTHLNAAGPIDGRLAWGWMNPSANPKVKTSGGGTGFGFIYKLSPGSSRWTGTKLATFHGWDGVYPIGGVILDSKGNLYGATYYRDPGFKGAGVVFQVTP
jgi:hypothetical protein